MGVGRGRRRDELRIRRRKRTPPIGRSSVACCGHSTARRAPLGASLGDGLSGSRPHIYAASRPDSNVSTSAAPPLAGSRRRPIAACQQRRAGRGSRYAGRAPPEKRARRRKIDQRRGAPGTQTGRRSPWQKPGPRPGHAGPGLRVRAGDGLLVVRGVRPLEPPPRSVATAAMGAREGQPRGQLHGRLFAAGAAEWRRSA